MGLVEGTTYQLQGHLPPKKHAFLVRLSSEVVAALAQDNHKQVHFNFNPDQQGIQVGDAFFPFSIQNEAFIHQLFLRAPSQAKPNAPFKLHANVGAKITVQQGVANGLTEITDKIRRTAQDAQEKKSGRSTIMLDGPLPKQTKPAGQKRKKESVATSAFRKPVRQSDVPPKPAPVPVPAVQVSAPTTNSPYHTKVLYYLALGQRTRDQVVAHCANDAQPDSTKLVVSAMKEVRPALPFPSHTTNTLHPGRRTRPHQPRVRQRSSLAS
jgi:hypothetical protein